MRASSHPRVAAKAQARADNQPPDLYDSPCNTAKARIRGVQDQASSGGRLYHEDIEIGRPYDCGRKIVTKEEIIAFARQFDPQPMHLDEEAAKKTLVGGLCASGFHTCVIMMRMVCDGILNRVASLGSPGVDEVRWAKPVRPGDALRATYLAEEKRTLASRPDVGVSKVQVDLVNDAGEVVAFWRTNQLTRLRNPARPPAQTSPKRQKQPIASLWDAPGPVSPPPPDAFFEDRQIGEMVDLDSHTFGRDEIIAFAREHDPQPFHLDEAAAKASLFGALSASGWHTAAHFIRGVVTSRLEANSAARARGERVAAYGPSPGFRNLNWPKPVFVGDTVSFRVRLTEKIDLKSRPDRGLLVSEAQGRNQRGEIVFAVTSQILAERREPFLPR
jgi:acyl dehydratase